MAIVGDDEDGVEGDVGTPFPGLSAEDRRALTHRIAPPDDGGGEGWLIATEERRRLARIAFAALEGADAIQPFADERTLWSDVHHLAALALDLRADALRAVRQAFAPNPARWPGRWRRIRALRVAWAMGEFAERAGFRFAPNPTSELLAEVEDLAGREAACALRHPEVIGVSGPMTAPQATRVAYLCAMIARGALEEAAHAPAFGHQREDDQGALSDAITDLLHAAAPLAAAGDASAALAVDLASAFRVHLAVVAQRDAAVEHFAVPLESFAPDDAHGAEQFRELWRDRGERLRPHLETVDPFADPENIGSQWRPSLRPESDWLAGWRQSVAFSAPGWTATERASAAFVMIAEARGWGPEAHQGSFVDVLRACIEIPDNEDKRDEDTRAIVRALAALGHNPRTFLRAEEEAQRRAAKRDELSDLRAPDPAAWRKTVCDAVVVAKGVSKKAADRLCCSVAELRQWIDGDDELARMVAKGTKAPPR